MIRCLLFLFISVGYGCATTTSIYHDDYGIGDDSNKDYVNERKQCRTEVFSQGVVIDNEKIMERDEIVRFYYEYESWLEKEIYAAIREDRDMQPIPAKYEDMERTRTEIGACMKQKGWYFKKISPLLI